MLRLAPNSRQRRLTANPRPLAGVFGDTVAGYSQLGAEARGVLCIGMLVGRVEVLAVIAVLNPEYWRG